MFDPAINAAIQRFHSPALDVFFEAVTVLGYSYSLIAVLCALYWTWDKPKVFGMFQLVVYCGLVEHVLKEIFQSPRPFQVDPQHVQVLDYFMRRDLHGSAVSWAIPAQTSYGFPSGHAQVAVCFLGALALQIRRRGMILLAVVLTMLIAFSRLYLGVHFLGDVLGGMLFGGVLLAIYATLVGLSARNSRFPSPELMCILGFAGPIVFYLLLPDREGAQRAMFLLGFTAGYFAERRFVWFSTSGPTRQRFARVACGLVVLACSLVPFDQVLGWAGSDVLLAHPITWTACRYGLIGLAVSWAIPWVFVRTGLATRSETREALGHTG